MQDIEDIEEKHQKQNEANKQKLNEAKNDVKVQHKDEHRHYDEAFAGSASARRHLHQEGEHRQEAEARHHKVDETANKRRCR